MESLVTASSQTASDYPSVLQDVIRSLATHMPLEELLNKILEHAMRLWHTTHGFIDLAAPSEVMLERRIGRGVYQKWAGSRRQWGEGLAGHAWQNGVMVCVDNYDAWPGRNPSLPLNTIGAAVALPLHAPTQVLGVLGLAYGANDPQPPHAFAPETLHQLQHLAYLASLVLENAQLVRQNHEAVEFTEGLYQAALSISKATTIREICQHLTIHFNTIVHADRTLMYLVDHKQRRILLHVGAGQMQETDFTETYAELVTGLNGQVFSTAQSVLSLDTAETVETSLERQRIQNVGAMIIAPITVNGEVIGTITTLNLVGQRVFTQYHVETLMTLATLAGTAIENTRLFEETQQANQILARRATQLLTSNLVGQQLTSILDPEELLHNVVHLIQKDFKYYYVGIWLLTMQRDAVILHAGAGETPNNLHGMRLPLDSPSLIAEVSRSGQGRIVDDVVPLGDNLILQALPLMRSEATFPLRVGDRLLGVLDLISSQVEVFGADDQLVLQTLADQIAIALRNAQLYTEQQQRRRLAEALEQAGRELTSTLDLEAIPLLVLTQLASVIPYTRGLLCLKEHGEFSIAAHHGFPTTPKINADTLGRHAFAQHIMFTGHHLIVDDVTQNPDLNPLPEETELRTWLGVPLISKNKTAGLIAVARTEADSFAYQDASLLAAFASQAAIALENARLYDETTRFSGLMERMVEARTAELHQAIAILEKLDKIKSSFIDVSAHELRTPLTVIKGYASMLNTFPFAKDPSIQPLLASLLGSINRLHEIINTMLDVAKLDAQKLDTRPEPVKLSLVFDRIVHEFKADLQDRQITLELVGISQIPIFQASLELLRKMFFQVVMNAIKYTPDGGKITITGQVLADSQLGGPALEVVVSDTGIGIDSRHHELIFEKLYTIGEVALHSSGRTKFKGGGPGLGLAIARGIARAHNGKIWVESAGHDETNFPGSRFRVLLPFAPLA